jgi:hypothetical protein
MKLEKTKHLELPVADVPIPKMGITIAQEATQV